VPFILPLKPVVEGGSAVGMGAGSHLWFWGSVSRGPPEREEAPAPLAPSDPPADQAPRGPPETLGRKEDL
jgi:hypothetical protein